MTATDYASVKAIAHRMGDTNNWYKTLPEEVDEPTVARTVIKLRTQLDERAQKMMVCSGIIFEKIHFRRVHQGGREEVVSTPFCITNNPDPSLFKSIHKIPDDCVHTLPEKEADFYLRYQNDISHIKLSSESGNCCALFKYRNNDILWEISVNRIKKMFEKTWNGSFVTAVNEWNDVIPIPIPTYKEKNIYNKWGDVEEKTFVKV